MTDQDRIKELEQKNEALKAQLATNQEQPDTSANAATLSVPLWKIIAFTVLLLLLSIGIYYSYQGHIIEVLTYLNISIFGFGILLVFAFLFSKETFLWFIGKKAEYHNILKAGQSLTTGAVGTALKYAPIELSEKEKEKVKKDIPALVEIGLMTGINNYIIRFFVGTFATSFALLGTIVLMNQNERFDIQNNLIVQQNDLVTKQNKRLDQQTYLQEAERRSSLVFLFSNIMDAVDKEIKDDYKKDKVRNLSPQLVGRITALSTRLKPYRYLDGDTLTAKSLSPERGQLLVSLLGSQLDTITMSKIYAKADFRYADLKDANLEDADLKDANLRYADLRYADLIRANLKNADLVYADLKNAHLANAKLRDAFLISADLRNADLRNTDLRSIDLKNVGLSNVNFNHADLRGADLRYTNLKDASLIDANLRGANLMRANLRNANLVRANLRDVFSRDADLSDANLTGANLRNADLVRVNLRNADLSQAIVENNFLQEHQLTTYQIDSTFENNKWIYRLKQKNQ